MISFITLFSLACTAAKPTDSGDELGEPDVEPRVVAAEIIQAFRVPERPWDLAADSNGIIYATTQAGSIVYTWNPETEEREELRNRFPNVVALAFKDETPYFTTTDNGVTGTLSQRVDNSVQVLASQSSDETLFRWPADLTATPDGGWIIPDIEAHVAFSTDSSNSNVTVMAVGSSLPETAAFFEGALYVGGEDGVFQKPWPTGPATQVDSRAAYGLAVYNGELLAASPEQGLFVVDGPRLELDGQLGARPASMLVVNEHIYVADRVGEWVYRVSINNE